MELHLINRSGRDTAALRRFFEAGLWALAPRRRGTLVLVAVAAPKRSRGCADVAGMRCSVQNGRRVCSAPSARPRMTIALAPPSYGSEVSFMRRLSRLFKHEMAHIEGMEHGDMPEDLLYSLGPTCAFAKNMRIPYRGRAPRQSGVVRA